MELVYLWVEKYKNIENQGFNFSPRFTCKYDDKTHELSIDENKEYVSIFPDNINITAIVGENGSGKSRLLEMIFLPHRTHDDNELKYIIFFKEKEVIKYYVSFIIKSGINIKNQIFDREKLSNIEKEAINTRMISGMSKSYADQFIRAKIHKTNEHFVGNMPYDSSIIIKSLKLFQLNQTLVLKDKNINFVTFKMRIKPIRLGDGIDKKTIEKYNTLIHGNSNSIKMFERFLKLPELQSLLTNNILAALINIYYGIPEFESFFNILDKNYEEINIDLIDSYIKPEDDIRGVLEIARDLYKIIEEYPFKKISLGSQDIGYEYFFDIKLHEKFLKEFVNKYNVFISLYAEHYFEFQMIEIDFVSADDLSLSSFSDGEKNIYSKIVDVKYEFLYNRNHYLLLLDEPDNFLHPNWAKEFILILLENIPDSQNKNVVNFIITSHSPFILSDLPKENIVFLKNGKQVNPNIETFGANIHTLLTHGFFMKDGLMGEFAKERINKAIQYLNKKTLSEKEVDYCENIISIIGEPILKRQLQKMLDSKRLTSIDNMDKKIKDMEYELSVLKKFQKKAANDDLNSRSKRRYTKKKKDDKSE